MFQEFLDWIRDRAVITRAWLKATFGLGPSVAISGLLLFTVVAVLAGVWYVNAAPPRHLTIVAGPKGSMFANYAGRYRAILARSGVDLQVIPTKGSRDNLTRLADPSAHVDLGFVHAGISTGVKIDNLMSLGSVAFEPLFIFYRGRDLRLLSELEGRSIAVGHEGSGTRTLAIALLGANEVAQAEVRLQELEPDEASKALLAGTADAAFVMGDSASRSTLRDLMREPGLKLYDFAQVDAYTRRIRYLHKVEIPRGTIDLGRDIPSHDLHLVAPTVELVARRNLHPALSDLLLDAAKEIHGRPTLFQKGGQFPAPLEREFQVSPDAARFYSSGKSFLYRELPFWLASLANRLLAVILPVIVLLLPGLRVIPAVYQWRIRSKIYKWYGALLLLERDLFALDVTQDDRTALLKRLDEIETEVHSMKLPASFADLFYGLRSHINLVRAGVAQGYVRSSQ